ncbi:MAG: hypothetical protein ABW184_12225 [Sphingobium sp.]
MRAAVIERMRRAAEERAMVVRARVRARIAAALPGAALEDGAEGVVVTGRGLVRRWVASDRLRDWREMEP